MSTPQRRTPTAPETRPLSNQERHHKANSAVSGSELSVKSKSNSVLSSGKENNDTVLPWKVKSGKASPNPDDILHIHPPLSYYDTNDNAVQQVFHNPNCDDDNHHNAHFMIHSQEQPYQQEDDDQEEEEEKEHELELEHVPANNFHYEARASPKPHYLNSPAPQYINSPKPQFLNSPAPKFMNLTAPKYMASPAPKYKNSPAPQFMNSSAPQYMSSPAPQFKNSPKFQFKNAGAAVYGLSGTAV
ncbi:hypothetical protein Fmac_002077 [Flemingia macrophylla]|uniref:Uncharacterized protein n=1 Tax=Flemingia macrophylla TaxID=520843 RepID=A0ABD1NK92_9FABA